MKVSMENARVERVFETKQGKWGASVVEEEQSKDGERTFKNYATLWFARRPELDAGDVVTASGFLSVRAREYNGQPKADVNVNAARIESRSVGNSAPVAEWAPPADGGWS